MIQNEKNLVVNFSRLDQGGFLSRRDVGQLLSERFPLIAGALSSPVPYTEVRLKPELKNLSAKQMGSSSSVGNLKFFTVNPAQLKFLSINERSDRYTLRNRR